MQEQSTLTGISFPFRVSSLGGIALSTTSTTNVSHIMDKITLVLTTFIGERTMESEGCSQVDTLVFKDHEDSTHTLLEYQVENALRQLNDVITVLSVNAHGDDNYMYVDIEFRLVKFDKVYTLKDLKVGDMTSG